MTDTPDPKAPPAAPPPPADPPAGEPPAGEAGPPQWMTRAGSVAMFLAIGAIVVIGLDVLLKGRLLGPLIRRLPAPAEIVDDGDDG